MSFATKILERFRNRLKRHVERERGKRGCTTETMRRIAKAIQMSPATLYRVMNGYGQVKIQAHQYMALLIVTLGSKAVPRSRRSKFCTAANSVEA